jgi:hypothetical protein
MNGRDTIPAGLVLELSRAKVLPGATAEVDRWMAMLAGRDDGWVASLHRERMALEIVFRLTEGEDEYLFWLRVRGASGETPDTSPAALDPEHYNYARRVKEPGWVEATPELLLVPTPVLDVIMAWARDGARPFLDHEDTARQ